MVACVTIGKCREAPFPMKEVGNKREKNVRMDGLKGWEEVKLEKNGA